MDAKAISPTTSTYKSYVIVNLWQTTYHGHIHIQLLLLLLLCWRGRHIVVVEPARQEAIACIASHASQALYEYCVRVIGKSLTNGGSSKWKKYELSRNVHQECEQITQTTVFTLCIRTGDGTIPIDKCASSILHPTIPNKCTFILRTHLFANVLGVSRCSSDHRLRRRRLGHSDRQRLQPQPHDIDR